MQQTATSTEIEAGEPPNQPPDKFKKPLPKCKSAFKSVAKPGKHASSAGLSSEGSSSSRKILAYQYILKKALRDPADISDNEKVILRNHPVITELIKQTIERGDLSKFSYYIPIDFIMNYEYFHNAKIPILYDSREK